MRSFQNVIVFLFALVACVFAAEEADSYDATVYITSTVYHLNTVTMSGSPYSAVANQTSTIPASTYTPISAPTYTSIQAPAYTPVQALAYTPIQAPAHTPIYVATGSYSINGTVVKPTGNVTKPAAPEFTGAASSLNAPALVAMLAAGVGYLVL